MRPGVPSPAQGPAGRGASSYLLLLEMQQLRRTHLAVAVCAGGCVPAHAASSRPCGPSTSATATATVGLPREAAHTILT